jgi:protein ImuB
MPARRLLSIWFPRLGAERLLRRLPGHADGSAPPLAVIESIGPAERVASVCARGSAQGIVRGMSLRDACAICPALQTRRRNAPAEAAFLEVLLRWAGRFSPWVACDGEDGLLLDITGCAHLFGGEAALVAQMTESTDGMGLTAQVGLADTRGAAWALARFAGQNAAQDRSGDAIDMEARATRSRAGKRRHWERGGTAPLTRARTTRRGAIAPRGETAAALRPLPVSGLRLDEATVATLSRLGLRRIGELMDQPRAALARRFGREVVLRLDQALGAQPEPLSPAAPPQSCALRLTLPEPIGRTEDVMAGVDRLLEGLCARLKSRGQAARVVALEAHRADHSQQRIEIRLARAADTPERLRGLLTMKIDEIDAGFGIDMLRLVACAVEPVQSRQPVGHGGAGQAVAARLQAQNALDDLVGRIGARVGLERITRRHPSDSHLPEKSAQVLAAAFSEPANHWPVPPRPRPLRLWVPEPMAAPLDPFPPERFRWRRRDLQIARARGPERIAPEWWLDAPEWRSGQRDYWDVVTTDGDRLWLFYAHGASMSPGWFCHGAFA